MLSTVSTVSEKVSIHSLLATIILMLMLFRQLFNLQIIGSIVPQLFTACHQWMKQDYSLLNVLI